MARAKRSLPTQAHIRECLSYDPASGEVWWLTRPTTHFVHCTRYRQTPDSACRAWNKKFAGKRAGYLHRGRTTIKLDTIYYPAGRIIWRYMTGEDPHDLVDHINRDPADSRWENLRLATPAQNSMNKPAHKNNKLGLKGVSYHPLAKSYYAYIYVNGKNIRLGRFSTPEEAHAAYAEASRKYHGAYGRTE